MGTPAPPLISSFIIRFVMEESSAEKPTYHGTIRHIQNAEEINFNEWHEAMEFMHRFIPLTDLLPSQPSERESPQAPIP